MKHPSQEILALQASGDLGLVQRWKTKLHLEGCPACRDEVAAYADMREVLPELNEIPEVPWNRIAAEMRANIHLGVVAGECVRESATPVAASPLFSAARATLVFGGVLAALIVGFVLQHPAPVSASEPMVQATSGGDGIQRRAGDQSFGLMNSAGAKSVTYSVSAQGSMGARYVDPETGNVTMTKVYVE
jgi:anti-sigma factor RsiW